MREIPPTSIMSSPRRHRKIRMSMARCCPRPCRNSSRVGPTTDRWLVSAMLVAASRIHLSGAFRSEHLDFDPVLPQWISSVEVSKDCQERFSFVFVGSRLRLFSISFYTFADGMVFLQESGFFSWNHVPETSQSQLSALFLCISVHVIHLGRPSIIYVSLRRPPLILPSRCILFAWGAARRSQKERDRSSVAYPTPSVQCAVCMFFVLGSRAVICALDSPDLLVRSMAKHACAGEIIVSIIHVACTLNAVEFCF